MAAGSGDLLSQEEIDALIRQLEDGEADKSVLQSKTSTKEMHKYDFAHPTKFNKEQLRTLENIFENYARLVSSFLTGYLRTPSAVDVANAEELSYKDFYSALLNPTVLCIVELLPLKGTVIIELSANVGYAIIDRILGGPGLGLKKSRDFSEIETILLERVVTQMLSYLPEPWENVVTIKPKLEKIETNSQFAQIIAPNERVALVLLNIKIGSSDGYIKFCIPHFLLKPVTEKLNTQYWFDQPEVEGKEAFRRRMEDELEKAVVPVTAIVGRTNITVNDFINLQVGDIIPLDSYINTDLYIMIGNMLKFRAKPGVSRGKNAFQITTLIQKEEMNNG